MTLPHPLLLASGCAVFCLAITRAQAADDEVFREYQFGTDGISEIEFNGGVGEMHFEPSPDGQVHLELAIEAQDAGWFQRHKDLENVELESRVRGERLILTQDEEDTKTTWRVQLPVVARTNVDMGVGEVEGVFGATELHVDLGVGDVDVELPLASTGEVDLSVGVGDAKLRGGRATNMHRTFVSQDVSGAGDGDKELRVKTGVGNIDVSLR
jgi:hypothetical protein